MSDTKCDYCGHGRKHHTRFGLGKLWCFVWGCGCVEYVHVAR